MSVPNATFSTLRHRPHEGQTPAETWNSAKVGWGGVCVGLTGWLLLSMRQSYVVPGLPGGLGTGVAALLLAALAWFAASLTGIRYPLRSPKLIIAVLLYVAGTLMAYGNAYGRGLSAAVTKNVDQGLILDICYLGAVLFILDAVRTRADLEAALRGLVLGATMSGLFALVQYKTGFDAGGAFQLPGLHPIGTNIGANVLREGFNRPQGSAGHPLELSSIMTILIPVAAGLVFSARSQGQRVWPWAVCATILSASALVTVSRSAIIGLLAAVLMTCWRWPIQRLTVLLSSAVLIGVVGAATGTRAVSALIATFAGSSTDTSIGSRVNGADYVWAHYADHFWFGQGVGTYDTIARQPVLDNAYFGRLMETGVFGLATFVGLLLVATYLPLRASAARDVATAELAGGIAGGLSALCVITSILDTGGFTQCFSLMWMLFALGAVAYREFDTDRRATAGMKKLWVR